MAGRVRRGAKEGQHFRSGLVTFVTLHLRQRTEFRAECAQTNNIVGIVASANQESFWTPSKDAKPRLTMGQVLASESVSLTCKNLFAGGTK
jgi:hypothetical protein